MDQFLGKSQQQKWKKINEQTKNIYRKAYINSRLVHLYNDNNVTKGLWIIIIEKITSIHTQTHKRVFSQNKENVKL